MSIQYHEPYQINPIAFIRSDFQEKFGIPRQSNLVPTEAEICFLSPYHDPDCVRGLEGFSHIWLIWGFSMHKDRTWHSTVRPPRLGGNQRLGVFATRSPFRPNPLGLSCVALKEIRYSSEGAILHVCGADLLDQTPIFDIKPYIPYADCILEASSGFTQQLQKAALEVHIDPPLLSMLPAQKQEQLLLILSEDPRPSYQEDPDRIYGMHFAGFNIRFRIDRKELYVLDVTPD